MLDSIAVYKIEDGEKKECNVVAFFEHAIFRKCYVIIEVSDNENENRVIPFLVDRDKVEQELKLIEKDNDKK